MSIKEDWENTNVPHKILIGIPTVPSFLFGTFMVLSGAAVPGALLAAWSAYCAKKGLEQSNPTSPAHDMMKHYPLHDDHHFD